MPISVPWITTGKDDTGENDCKSWYVTLPSAPEHFIVLYFNGISLQSHTGLLYRDLDNSVNYGYGSCNSGATSYSIRNISDNVVEVYSSRAVGYRSGYPQYSGNMTCIYQ